MMRVILLISLLSLGSCNILKMLFGGRTDVNDEFSETRNDSNNSSSEIGGIGAISLSGTSSNGSEISLSTNSNTASLDESWTPQWSNLASYWQLDESGGWTGAANEVIDSVGSNNGVRSAGTGTTSTGSSKVGDYGGSFDGTTSIDTGSNFIANDYTKMAWINPNSANAGDILSSSGTNHRFRVASACSGLGADQSSTDCIVNNTIQTGVWSHVAVSYDSVGDMMYLYINGNLVDSAAYATSPPTGSNLYIGSYGGATSYFDGSIDEVAVWNSVLSESEIAIIYKRQAFDRSGQMISEIFDLSSIGSQADSISWETSQPFGKELTSSNEDTSEYSNVSVNLADGLVGHWKFNEFSANAAPSGNDVEDFSGLGYHLSLSSGTLNHGLNSPILGQSVEAPVNDARLVSGGFTEDLSFFSVSAWVNMYASSNWLTIFSTDDIGYAIVPGNNPILKFTGSGGSIAHKASTTLTDGKWHHIAVTYDSSSDVINYYLDGVLDHTTTLASGTLVSSDLNLLYNISGNGGADPFNGQVDEIGLWERVLDSSEVLQLYRRGANKLKLQVRSCSSSDCSDQDSLTGDGWMGPGGNYYTYFSEIHNNSTVDSSCSNPQACFSNEIDITGSVNSERPEIFFNQFGGDGISVPSNTYFQYRVILESDDQNDACSGSPCLPELKDVSIN